jgi:hypothetical protein
MEPETYQHPKQPHAEKPLAVYPTDPNPPKNAAYWKRRALKAEKELAYRVNNFENSGLWPSTIIEAIKALQHDLAEARQDRDRAIADNRIALGGVEHAERERTITMQKFGQLRNRAQQVVRMHDAGNLSGKGDSKAIDLLREALRP